MSRRAPLVWAAVVVPLWIVLILCTHWEPVARDGWSNVQWHRLNKLDWGQLWALTKYGWLGSNPRLGQVVTTLLYTPGWYHAAITPVFELALFYLLTALALGRWPSARKTEDAFAFVLVFALVALCTPQFGPMLFYRPFTGNYVFGLLLNVAWLVPYRFHVERDTRARHTWWTPLLLVLGFAAGMCNEHTGVAFLVLGAAAMVWSWKRGHGVSSWMIAGLVGLAAGFVLLLMAPGQDARYAGIARQAGLLERVLDRGIVENVKIVGRLAMYIALTLPWIALGVVARRRTAVEPLPAKARWALLALAAAGLLVTLTLMASPKIGPRLYLASIALVSVAVAGWLVTQLRDARVRVLTAVLAALVVVYVEARCLWTYAQVGPVGADRIYRVWHGRMGTVLVVPRYPLEGGKWFIGEDFVAANLRAGIAADYGYTAIELEPAR